MKANSSKLRANQTGCVQSCKRLMQVIPYITSGTTITEQTI